MSIVKRGNNSWQVRIFLGRDDAGRMKFHNETVRGCRKDAITLETKRKREIDLGVFVNDSKTTLSEYLDTWFEVAARPRLKDRTYEDYKEYMKRYISQALGNHRLSKIRPLDIQAVYSKMLESGLSARTIRYTHAILSSSLKQAVKWQLLNQNPASMVDLPKICRKEMKAVSDLEAARFITVAKEDYWHVIFCLALSTGMRPEEYLGLRWKDVDLTNGSVVVNRVLVWKRKGGGWSLQEPKTSNSRRSILLPKSVVSEIKIHRKRQLEERMKRGHAYGDQGFVFATTIGSPISPGNLTRRHFKPILKKAGLSVSIRLYDLRHTCATLLLLKGVNPKVVAERLGHSSIVLTLDTYSHVLPSMQKEATNELESLLFKSNAH